MRSPRHVLLVFAKEKRRAWTKHSNDDVPVLPSAFVSSKTRSMWRSKRQPVCCPRSDCPFVPSPPRLPSSAISCGARRKEECLMTTFHTGKHSLTDLIATLSFDVALKTRSCSWLKLRLFFARSFPELSIQGCSRACFAVILLSVSTSSRLRTKSCRWKQRKSARSTADAVRMSSMPATRARNDDCPPQPPCHVDATRRKRWCHTLAWSEVLFHSSSWNMKLPSLILRKRRGWRSSWKGW